MRLKLRYISTILIHTYIKIGHQDLNIKFCIPPFLHLANYSFLSARFIFHIPHRASTLICLKPRQRENIIAVLTMSTSHNIIKHNFIIEINSRIWFGPVYSNFHFEGCNWTKKKTQQNSQRNKDKWSEAPAHTKSIVPEMTRVYKCHVDKCISFRPCKLCHWNNFCTIMTIQLPYKMLILIIICNLFLRTIKTVT